MLVSHPPQHNFQVGGSLPFNSATYVQRQADEDLLQGLLQGEFCYVFNARQMGKSSLRVRVTRHLQTADRRCGVIDITTIGTQEITAEQWYASIAGLLVKTFQLKVNLLTWWCDRSHLSLINRLSEFLDEVLLSQVVEKVVIFIDEIDSILSLKFSVDDFFALIRACYNRRAEQPQYERLTFALFGVATPGDLISDPSRTPFNIGKAIELRGFQFTEAAPLVSELAKIIIQPQTALKRILYWTAGQPFLTQKLCQLVAQNSQDFKNNSNFTVTDFIDRLVTTRIIQNWEYQDEPEHLKTIRDRLLYSEQQVGRLLGLYQQILLHSSGDLSTTESGGIIASDSPEQTKLILTGLVEKRGEVIQSKNLIYQQIFDFDWAIQQLENLRPYSQIINAWIISGYQDESWLLRGQALRDILAWAQEKSLSDLDYRFLAASQKLDRQETQKTLEAERIKEVEARLKLERQRSWEQQHHLRRQRVLLSIVSLMMTVAIALGFVVYWQYQQTTISEVRAIALSSEALYASNKWFDALLQAIKGKERLQRLKIADVKLQAKVDAALQRVILSIQESNRLNGHTTAVLAIDFSPDGQQIATASVDGTIKIWQRDGNLINTFKAHQTVIRAIKFSPDGTLIASAGDEKKIKIWQRNGKLLKTITTNNPAIWSLDFSPDSTTLISSGASTLEVWSRDGKLHQTLAGKTFGIRDVTFSPDGKTIAAAGSDKTIKIWHLDGRLPKVFPAHDAPVQAIAFSPDGAILVSGSVDGTIKLWNRESTLLATFKAHDASIARLDFSPDGKMFASASWDKTVKLWNRDGNLLTVLRGHDASTWGVVFSPDGQAIASAGADNIAIIWKSQSIFQRSLQGITGTARKVVFNPDGTAIAVAGTDETIKISTTDGTLLRTINAHDAPVFDIDWSPDGKAIVSGSEDKTVKIWQADGTLLQTLKGHSSAVLSVAWNPVHNIIAASGADGTILLWRSDGRFLKTLKGHRASVWSIEFSPDGEQLVSGSNDTEIRLWNLEGQLLKILKGHNASVWKVAFSPDGELLASGSGDLTVKLWRRDGTLSQTLTGHTAAIWGIDFSPDGSLIATASVDESVKLWQRDGRLITTLKGHRAAVRNVMFHQNRPILASAGDDQTMILWDLEQIFQLHPLTYGCNWVRDYLQTNTAVEEGDRHLCQ